MTVARPGLSPFGRVHGPAKKIQSRSCFNSTVACHKSPLLAKILPANQAARSSSDEPGSAQLKGYPPDWSIMDVPA